MSIVLLGQTDECLGFAPGAVSPTPISTKVPPRPCQGEQASQLSFGTFLEERNRADRARQVEGSPILQRANRDPAATCSHATSTTDQYRPRLLAKLGEVSPVKPEPRVQHTVKVERLEREFATGRLIDVIA